jgi:hypothetical protein
MDLLLTFYNREPQSYGVLVDNLTPVIEILSKWKYHGVLSA